MTSFKDELARVLAIKDEMECAARFQELCQRFGSQLPAPGEDVLLDKAMWAASQYMPLSPGDRTVVRRVVDRMLAGSLDVVSAYAVKLKDLIGAGKEAALRAWEEALAGLAWQQMAPAGALRGVGCQMVSMGTFRTHVQDADIQLNLGWMVDTDQLRILLQARDSNDNALPGVELKVEESGKGVVFSRRTNQDGAMVAPSVPVEPGRYRIQIEYKAEVAETPYFLI